MKYYISNLIKNMFKEFNSYNISILIGVYQRSLNLKVRFYWNISVDSEIDVGAYYNGYMRFNHG